MLYCIVWYLHVFQFWVRRDRAEHFIQVLTKIARKQDFACATRHRCLEAWPRCFFRLVTTKCAAQSRARTTEVPMLQDGTNLFE